jgi:DNA-binding beta-propeller fold protein YncE
MGISIPFAAVIVATSIKLLGGPPVGMDYIALDPATGRVWVPAGNTGSIQVIDIATGKVNVLASFPTAPSHQGRPPIGPSSAALAGQMVWVGNRGDNQLLAFDARTLKPTSTVQLDVAPDGLAYVARNHELWATTPADRGIKVIDVDDKPHVVANIIVDGTPEGYAVDDSTGVFYTNLEDKDQTLAIDIRTREVVDSWSAGCASEGPRGLALDSDRRWLFVACTDGAGVVDLAHPRKTLSRLKTGAGVDNLAYDPARHRLFIAAAKNGTLTIARVSNAGDLIPEATVPTKKGARNPVVDKDGRVYVEDAQGGQLLVIDPNAPVRP